MKLISLSPNHTKSRSFKHPLLNNAQKYSREELEQAARDPHFKLDKKVWMFSYEIKTIVGRYLYYWPQSRRFQDEMISECYLTLIKLLKSDLNFDILKTARRRFQAAINTFLNKNRSLAAPSLRSQKHLRAGGLDPIYLKEDSENKDHFDEGDEWKRDLFDSLSQIKVKDEIDSLLLDRASWDLNLRELAASLKISITTVHRRRRQLYNQFRNLER